MDKIVSMKNPLGLRASAPGRMTVLAALLAGLSLSGIASAGDLVISQIYGGGGNSGSVYRSDFIEIFNKSSSPVSLAGKSVQYASSTGSSWAMTPLTNVTLAPGQFYLIQQATGADTAKPALPAPDATGTITMSATTGKVVLSSVATQYTIQNPEINVIDKIGFGPGANGFEGSPTAALTNGTGARRIDVCADLNQNNTEFVLQAPVARNSGSPLAPCGVSDAPIVAVCPANIVLEQGVGNSAPLSASDADGIVDSASLTSAVVPGISLGTVSAAPAAGGSASVSLNIAPSLAAGSYPVKVTFGNSTGQQTTCNISVGVQGTASIPVIQGSGATSPFNNVIMSTEGVVTHLVSNGYFLQDAAGDGDPSTSDALFVFTSSKPTVAVGDQVRVKGLITEYQPVSGAPTYTEMKDVLSTVKLSSGNSITPTNITFDSGLDLERLESMLVSIGNPLTVNQTSYLGERGELTLAVGRRETATNRYRPGTPEALAQAAANAANVLVLDDSLFATPAVIPYIGADGTVRAGDTVTGLTGVVDFGSIGGGGAAFKIQPSVTPVFSRTNPRTGAPALAPGDVKVASANVLNFFTSFLDGTNSAGVADAGCKVGSTTRPSNCRGADNMVEFVRQRDKIVNFLKAIDADVVGLMEIQNNGDIAVDYLVNALNTAIGSDVYTYVPKPAATGTDAIRVAMIYKKTTGLTLVGGALSDGDAVNNRPPMAQTFKAANGAVFSVIVNHLKSKGSCGTGADRDLGDGQGCNNASRVQQAARLRDYFIPVVVAAAGDPDVLVIGDMNAHGFEDPIHLLNQAGYVNELERFVRPVEIPYSYVFDGEVGYLDHALASASLDPQVAGAAEWHANADEPTVIDYNTDDKSPAAVALYDSSPYRASDHDAVLVSLNLPATFSDISAQFSVARSGLYTNRITGKTSGTVTLTNKTAAPINGKLLFKFASLTPGVSVDNATGMHEGAPYISVNSDTIAPGGKITFSVVFSNPSKGAISYTNKIYSGNF